MALIRPFFAVLLLAAGPVAANPNNAGWRFYDAGQFAEARVAWEALAAAGDPDAAFGLGVLYDLGQGGVSDGPQACAWYGKAGGAGHAQGAFNAAVMHDSGRCGAAGSSGGTGEAATWYARAAVLGIGRAQFNLGQLYAAGEGVPRNPGLASAWFRAAAANGIPAATGRPSGPGLAAGPLVPAIPVSPAEAARVPAAPGVPLVWTAAPGPGPVEFFVEVMALGPDGPRPLPTRTVEVSAALMPLPPQPGRYAWRVSAVALDSPHYALGPWRSFSTVTTP